jgi:hypothetical protein
MKRVQSIFVLAGLLQIHSSLYCQRFETVDTAGMHWYRGNLHTHAREGESDSSVEFIVHWYRAHDYHFLVITDHSTITTFPALAASQDTSFILIPGEEVIGNANEKELEINAFNIHKPILPIHNLTLLTTLQECIDSVRVQNGVPMINHPNYNWRLNKEILLKSRNCSLFELYNGFPGTHSQGDETHPGMEEVWDFMLTSGKRIYGVATDDAHVYQEFSPELSNPGRGWVMVKSHNLEVNEIMKNLEAGLFYSSTGVHIVDFQVEADRIEIAIKKREDTEYTTHFIGAHGKLLSSTNNNPAVYHLSTDSQYVRAKVIDSNGHCAWTQPVFIN